MLHDVLTTVSLLRALAEQMIEPGVTGHNQNTFWRP